MPMRFQVFNVFPQSKNLWSTPFFARKSRKEEIALFVQRTLDLSKRIFRVWFRQQIRRDTNIRNTEGNTVALSQRCQEYLLPEAKNTKPEYQCGTMLACYSCMCTHPVLCVSALSFCVAVWRSIDTDNVVWCHDLLLTGTWGLTRGHDVLRPHHSQHVSWLLLGNSLTVMFWPWINTKWPMSKYRASAVIAMNMYWTWTVHAADINTKWPMPVHCHFTPLSILLALSLSGQWWPWRKRRHFASFPCWAKNPPSGQVVARHGVLSH